MAVPPREQFETAKTIAGPFSLYSNSFEVEFLEPPQSLHATVLMKATYIFGPKLALGKSHGQSPPLHLHFDQSESFFVSSGLLGTTSTWDNVDKALTPADGLQHFPPWMPHRFWPHPDAKEDTTIYVWAHPDDVQQPMDWLFFLNLLRYLSDVDEGKASLDPFYIMTVQHASATALVWLPRQKWLGPLRWWVPWKVQGAFAAVGNLLGYRALLEKYTPKEEWENYVRTKRT